jgi:hypothetical protein
MKLKTEKRPIKFWQFFMDKQPLETKPAPCVSYPIFAWAEMNAV